MTIVEERNEDQVLEHSLLLCKALRDSFVSMKRSF